MNDTPSSLQAADRFDRQVRFAPFGAEGQARLQSSRALVVGCGALGGVLAQNLVRSGVGELVLVDRDVVEPSNLPRQVLFFDSHAAEAAPKALAARETLAAIGGPTRITAHATQLDADNIHELAEGCAVIFDGTDNLATRYLLNDYCVQADLPWVYAGVVGAAGIVLPVLTGQGACLRCVFPDPPPLGALDTCESAGVLQPAVAAVASLASGIGLRILADPGARQNIEPALVEIDVWNGNTRRILAPKDPDCPACGHGELPFLVEARNKRAERLCGRNTVQIPAAERPPKLGDLAKKLETVAEDVSHHEVLLRFVVEGHRLTVFRDGRTLVEGTEDPARARALFDRYVGS